MNIVRLVWPLKFFILHFFICMLFPNTCAWEQQKWKKRMKQKEGRQRIVDIHGRSTAGTNRRSSDGLTIVRAYSCPLGRYCPKLWMDYRINLTYTKNTFSASLGYTYLWLNLWLTWLAGTTHRSLAITHYCGSCK